MCASSSRRRETGKNAVPSRHRSLDLEPPASALRIARCDEPARLICPAPIPTVAVRVGHHRWLDFHVLTHCHAIL